MTGRPARPGRSSQKVTAQKWYPSRDNFANDQKGFQQWDTHMRTFDHIYEMQEQLDRMAVSLRSAIGSSGSGSGSSATGGSATGNPGKGSAKSGSAKTDATHILGFRIKATIPKDGQTLKYSQKEDQFILS